MKKPKPPRGGRLFVRGPCPHPEKTVYIQKKHAKRAARRYHGQRVYKCECGAYHLTRNRVWHTSKIEMHETRFGERPCEKPKD